MTPTRFLVFLAVLFQAALGPANALSFPLFPGTPETVCSLADFPWYICNQSENVDSQAVPNFYNRLVGFFGGGEAGEDDVDPNGDYPTRRQLRKGIPPKQE